MERRRADTNQVNAEKLKTEKMKTEKMKTEKMKTEQTGAIRANAGDRKVMPAGAKRVTAAPANAVQAEAMPANAKRAAAAPAKVMQTEVMPANAKRATAAPANVARNEGRSAGSEKPAVCRSIFMSLEEIEAERRQSGWNPYAGEEEAVSAPGGVISGGEGSAAWNGEEAGFVPEETVSDGEQSSALRRKETDSAAETAEPDEEGDSVLREEGTASVPGEISCGEYIPGAVCLLPFARYEQTLESLQAEKEVDEDLRRLQTLYPEAAKQLLPYIEDVCDRMEYDGSFMFDEYPDLATLYRLQGEISGQVSGQAEKGRLPDYPEDLIRVLLVHEMHRRRSRRRCIRRQ